jgi:putative transferase (TIGR04331 family)
MNEHCESNTRNGESTYLVSSAIEATWPVNQPIIFLGKWCLRYSRRQAWSELDYSVAPYHWDDRTQIPLDLEFISKEYELALHDLTQVLNGIHGVVHTERYWRIVVGSWLYYFCQVVWDRWKVLNYADETFVKPTLFRLSSKDEPNASPNSAVFFRATETDAWNERLFADMADQWTGIEVITVQFPQGVTSTLEKENKSDKNVGSPNKRKYHFSLVRSLNWLGRRTLFYGAGVSLFSDYLRLKSKFQLSLLMGQLPILDVSHQLPSVEAQSSWREWKLSSVEGNAFRNIVANLIPQYLPTCYLEGYKDATLLATNSDWTRQPRILMTANAFDSDDRWKLWAASQVDKGARLVISQHGGGYGSQEWSAMQNYELGVCDRYITWGWSESDMLRAHPAPATKLLGIRRRHPKRTGHCLLVTAALPRQSYWMYSAPVGPQFENYLEDQFRFAAALDHKVRDDLLVRLFHRDYGWDIKERWQDREPTIATDAGHENLDKILNASRLYVSTYNATTFLESFTRGMPTLVYWDPKYWELSSSAQPYFDLLREAGILFDDPVICADMVNSIWDDIPDWWHSSEVQLAVKVFSERFAHVGPRPLRRLKSALTDW